MNQNFGKKKTGMVVAISVTIIALTLSPIGFDQAVATQDYDNNKSLSAESNLSSSLDKTIRLTGEEPSFVPSYIKINLGEKVTFINVDGTNGGMIHAIISVNGETGIPDNAFDSGLLHTGDRFQVQFDERGIYDYVDSIQHSEVYGTILVE